MRAREGLSLKLYTENDGDPINRSTLMRAHTKNGLQSELSVYYKSDTSSEKVHYFR